MGISCDVCPGFALPCLALPGAGIKGSHHESCIQKNSRCWNLGVGCVHPPLSSAAQRGRIILAKSIREGSCGLRHPVVVSGDLPAMDLFLSFFLFFPSFDRSVGSKQTHVRIRVHT
ncbi:hypothetical protein CGRA01v4_11511 [Colletotrichum graminicola]|nr:hypothetical protein CGRA01v4_11511 [Colletotrichum graminicola]